MTVTVLTNPGGNEVLRERSKSARWILSTIAVVAFAGLVAACGGGGESSGKGGGGDAPAGKPVSGGDLVYGLEAETSGGWCLAESQLAISGIQVARAVYDTLTAPNADDEYVPFLAESVKPDATYTTWTITLRSGVKFSDGSPLTATVVKNNLDAYRGKYPARKPLLFIFVLQNVKDVTVVDDLNLTVTTVTPWPSFPAFLHSSGRLGIMGQAQLDDPKTCDRNLIGTGPFKLKEWKPDDQLTVVKNPDYWRKDKNGVQLPYLNSITFKPYPDAQARLNALQSGELSAGHYSGAEQIDALRTAKENGTLQEIESEKFTELSYGLLNVSKPPFNNKNARLALAYGTNRKTFNKALNLDILNNASGPFAPGEIGYL
ncbi:MAG: ABC transporter substrate-binding protein, partial [Actinomycetes bacterium]